MQQFKVDKVETAKFAKVWTYNGLVIPFEDVHHQFACDWANVVMNNFIAMCQQNAAAAMQKKIEEKNLIVEG